MSLRDRINKYLEPVDNYHTVRYIGKAFSLNDIYSSGNKEGAFWKRKNIKDKYSKIFRDLIRESELVPFNKFILCVFYNSRHDVDNIVGMGKVFADTLREEWVPNDNKKHYRGLLIFVDDDLDLDEFDFIIIKKDG